jgi:hypothetical protein
MTLCGSLRSRDWACVCKQGFLKRVSERSWIWGSVWGPGFVEVCRQSWCKDSWTLLDVLRVGSLNCVCKEMHLWEHEIPEIGLVCANKGSWKESQRDLRFGDLFWDLGLWRFVDRVGVRTLEHSWMFSELGLWIVCEKRWLFVDLWDPEIGLVCKRWFLKKRVLQRS